MQEHITGKGYYMITVKRYWRYFDWISFGIMIILSCIGLGFVFSATYRPEIPYSIFFKKQLLGSLSGLIIYFCACFLDYRTFCRWGFYAFFGVMGLLAFTIIKGSVGMGAQRWINLLFFKVQPSELVKLFFPAFISYLIFWDKKEEGKPSLKTVAHVMGILSLGTFLIVKQPDLGTALIILFSSFLILWLAGVCHRFFIIVAVACLLFLPLGWHLLHPYQQKRIFVFLGQGEAQRERYQIEQSKIAIGSGSFTGKGFLQGTQNKLRFLPEGRTDFIFAVICEELGFLGGIFVLLLFALLFTRLFFVIWSTKSLMARITAIGLCTHIMLATLINSAMVLGLLPIVGIPLPLLSYGICHTWTTLASLGMLNSIAIRRFYH